METPYFLLDEEAIQRNCQILAQVKAATGCKILLAQKAFSCFDCYPLISKYLDGTTASGLFEARLGSEAFGKETHVFAPAFTDADFAAILPLTDHVVFNSKAQLFHHLAAAKKANVSVSLRVNPEFRTQEHEIYDPCAPFSRFGVRAKDLDDETISHLDGLHFHTLCEQGLAPLARTVSAFEKKFARALEILKSRGKPFFVNFGGGHHITAKDYDVDGLINLINDFQGRHGCVVYLEPGEAVVLNAGTLTASVLDIVENGRTIAILDTSAACHNPDILETAHDYTPDCTADKETTKGTALVRLAGNTCLAGDFIGDYELPVLAIGDTVTFHNMALYTIVKINTFNGIRPPAIYLKTKNGAVKLLRSFDYFDFKNKLGSVSAPNPSRPRGSRDPS